MRARFVPASLTHVGPLARTMRLIDRQECEAFGRTPKEALRISLRTSLHSVTALDPEGKPLAMFGVSPVGMLSSKGAPWFLGRDDVFQCGRDLLMVGARMIAHWQETFDLLENVVSVDNTKAIRLLKRWGAEVGGERAVHRGVEFVPFRWAIQA